MRFGMSVAPFGDFGNPLALAELAQKAETSGWDGFFIWDHIMFDPTFHPIVDPWVGLTAVALHTSRIRIGTMVTPLPRRRPWKVARETVSLDHASKGRLILGVGLGDPSQWDYGFFGEETDAKIRAEKLDESLDILVGLWSGKPFQYQGKHYRLKEVHFLPQPVQQPRIPIWVGGWWPNKPPMRRAARWDGAVPVKDDGIPAEEWRTIKEFIHQHRQGGEPFDFVHNGASPGDNPYEARRIVKPYEEAGVDWWIEGIDPWRFGWKWEEKWSKEASLRIEERILQGPPRVPSS
jgi:alkanesulfonate monooxygenase SsuD/methylene tetrahydromethanopterin reductase-like flavin-dependent oxidoreductase (luciferase family)